jgi:serine/threonine protein kinase
MDNSERTPPSGVGGLYPRKLSYGANNTVIVLSETEVGKLFTNDTRSDIGSEAEKMKFANNINDLIVKFERLEKNENLKANMLVMERIFPIDFRAHEVEMREIWFDIFEEKILELHAKGFVHNDLKRPLDIGGERFDNILLTNQGLRLIDVGVSILKNQVGDKFFKSYIENEIKELNDFKEYFLNR